ncbi:MAG: hypothetical protein V1794_05360 [Candidatus Glassbacteria bacterium]
MPNRLTAILLACVALTALTLTAAQAADNPLQPALAELDSLISLRDRTTAGRDSLNREAGTLAGEVSRLKTSQARSYSTIDQYRLEASLRRSQALAARLDSLAALIARLEDEAAGRRNFLAERIDRELDSLAGRFEAERDGGRRALAAGRIDSLRRLRARLASLPTGGAKADTRTADLQIDRLLERIKVTPADSPEEILEKADFLADVAGRWRKTLDNLQHSIGRLADEREMRARLGEFTQELSLFDAAGPSSRAGVSTASADRAAQDKTGETLVAREPGDYLDFSVDPRSGVASAGQSLDIELSNPEGGVPLQNIDQVSSRELEAVIGQLSARRDSLEQGLSRLRQAESEFRRQAGSTGREQEVSPRK